MFTCIPVELDEDVAQRVPRFVADEDCEFEIVLRVDVVEDEVRHAADLYVLVLKYIVLLPEVREFESLHVHDGIVVFTKELHRVCRRSSSLLSAFVNFVVDQTDEEREVSVPAVTSLNAAHRYVLKGGRVSVRSEGRRFLLDWENCSLKDISVRLSEEGSSSIIRSLKHSYHRYRYPSCED